ncbi:MAG: type II/IV secretion system ATPase subunit [Sulfolobales archaeon]|nr:type II/IV secretion system ATPase subunit [Sulfolobales archaeon]MCX8185566.1 type II/IV secretion system ATPase subunit [Sulfolobales archaeon]MDW7969509.1 type II/IV secretion system ATPase subunit [Sulfolobales archaeon]
MFDLFRKKLKDVNTSPSSDVYLQGSVGKPLVANIIDFYPIIENYSYAFIYVDPSNQKVYEIIEPTLTAHESSMVDLVKRRTFESESVAKELRSITDVRLGLEVIKKAIKGGSLGIKVREIDDSSIDKISYYVSRDLVGYSVLDPLIRDARLEDIVCSGINIPIYVFHNVYEWLKTNVLFSDFKSLDSIINRLAFKAGIEISIAKPIVEGVLTPEGFRVHVVIDVVARRGSTFTIRKFKSEPFTLPQLVNLGTLDPLVAAYLWILVENLQNALIVGPTASGKTTLLNAMSLLIPPEVKVVTVEESPELNLLGHENWVSLVTRLSYEAGVTNVNLYELLKSALRQRPDVIIVGEIRGEEAYTFFQAVSLGHGGLATIHAENVESVIQRLLAEPFNIPKNLLQLVKVYICLGRVQVSEGIVSRRILEIREVEGLDPRTGELIVGTPFKWNRNKDAIIFSGYSHLIKLIAEKKQVDYYEVFDDLLRRATIMKWVAKRKAGIKELQSIIREFRSNWLTIYSIAESEVGRYAIT